MGWIPKRAPKAHMSGVLNGKLKPLARSEDLLIEEVGDELLVYDQHDDRAHCLGPLAASVWRACDGETSADAIAEKLSSDADSVAMALAQLSDIKLLEGGSVVVGGMTRRDLGFRAAKVGAAAATVPLIVSITAPVAEAAATPTAAACLLYTDQDCSNCKNICGCCCCGQSSNATDLPACKTCYTEAGCPTIIFTDPNTGNQVNGHCAATAPPPPKCDPAEGSYKCKSGQVVTIGGATRCCQHEPFTCTSCAPENCAPGTGGCP